MEMPTTTVRLSEEADSRLRFLAAGTGRTKAFYLREIIENGLDDAEDYYLAAGVLEQVRKGSERIYSSRDVRRELGLGD
jgi:RHH-type rel operon transcriptional repressor/antitoxin RelB